MKKSLTLAAALLALAASTLVAASAIAAPQSEKQTSRSSAMKQMAACQHRADHLKGNKKQEAVASCMKTG